MSDGHLPPVGDPKKGLSPVAGAILNAAQRIVIERGFEALTLNTIAAESGENKAMVSYYFGNKAGLVAAILDSIIYEECVDIAGHIGSATGPERLHRAIAGIARTTAEPGFYRGFFDIFPHAARDPELRKRLVTLYQWYSEVELGWLGLESGGAPGREQRLRALAQLVAAAIDGLGIQARIDPEHFDTAGAFAVLELLLRNSWAEFAPQLP